MSGTAPEPEISGKAQELADQLAERTFDLQRLSAEYANYRKRIERDRLAVREQALANVLSSLLPVLDDIGRARQHSELVGGFKSVAESLEAVVAKLGLSSFGEDGEAFDPRVHEAVAHSFSAEITEPSVTILQPGYKVGERILRPAMVSVAEPAEAGAPGTPAEPGGTSGPGTPAGPPSTDGAGTGPAGSPGAAEDMQANGPGAEGRADDADAAAGPTESRGEDE